MAGERSVGLLLYRKRPPEGHVEVLIAKMGGPFWANKHAHSWTVPKGLVTEADADDAAAAEREFAEEMGRSAPPGTSADLGTSRSGSKTIVVLAREGDFDADDIVSNTFEVEWPPRSGLVQQFPEVERASWVTPQDARQLLAKSQTVFIDRLLELLANTGEVSG
ncbi:MAG: NUDIX domain-containing protein [Acidimicrobiales bacterium]|nr:NUDIX domain-containing protein [Acidimicrobiales bacterium]